MSHMIRLPNDIYKRLENHAQGFDTPANVIKKLLDHYEGIEGDSHTETSLMLEQGGKDYTKFIFEDVSYGKGRLVLAVVRAYVAKHQKVSFAELNEAFPSDIQGSIGIFSEKEAAIALFEETGHKRHFLKQDELIQIQDCVIAVSREWGKGNINNFIGHARSLGFDIQPWSK